MFVPSFYIFNLIESRKKFNTLTNWFIKYAVHQKCSFREWFSIPKLLQEGIVGKFFLCGQLKACTLQQATNSKKKQEKHR